jgi:NAD(P)-dependent dehydrogenase (short-subunit alcohol dehydrogenase family)
MTMVASTSLLTRAIIVSIVLVVVIAILEAIPHRQLDWDDTILPLARKYAGVTNGSDQRPLRGKIVVITGCTSGIGLSLTRAVSKLGATVVGIGRNRDRLKKLKDEIPTLEMVRADFNNLTSVSAAADEIVERWDHIDILVNNAGMHDWFASLWGPVESVQGYDRTFTVNYLSHLLLTEKLSPTIHNNATTRPTLVQTSSFIHWSVDGSDLMVYRKGMPLAAQGGSTGFSLFRSQHFYSDSKLAQLYHTRALRRKHPLWSTNKAARAVSFCPGFVASGIAAAGGGLINWAIRAGFQPEGWGIASALVAMLDDRTSIGDCTAGNNPCDDYYSNSRAASLYNMFFSKSLIPTWLPSLRDALGVMLGIVTLPIQKIGYHLGPSTSSPESYDDIIGNALYYWSLQAIHEYL